MHVRRLLSCQPQAHASLLYSTEVSGVALVEDNAAVLGDFTYPVAKHAEGEALLSQIMSSVKFK